MLASIVSVKSGQTLPEDFIKEMHSKTGTLMSFVTGGKENSLIIARVAKDKDWADSVARIELRCKEQPRGYLFSKFDKPLDNENLQPYTVLTGTDNKAKIAVLVEGAFHKFGGKQDGHSPEWHFTQEYKRFVDMAYKKANGDFAKTMEYLDSEGLRKKFQEWAPNRGAMLVVPYTGKHILYSFGVFGETGDGQEYDWGITTRKFGYNPPKEEVKSADDVEMDELDALLAEAPPFTPDATSKLIPAEKKTETAAQPPAVTYSAPVGLTNKERLKWLMRNVKPQFQNGPGPWAREHMTPDSPAVQSASGVVKSFDDAKKQLDKKAAEPHRPLAITSGFIKTIGTQIKDEIVQLKDKGKLEVDPNYIEELDKPFDKFSEQLKLDADDILFWKPEQLLMIKNIGMVFIILEMQKRIHDSDPTIKSKMLEKLTTPKKDETSAEDELEALLA